MSAASSTVGVIWRGFGRGGFFSFRRLTCQMTEEAVDHFPHLDNLGEKSHRGSAGYRPEVSGSDQMVFEFRRRVESNPQESSELAGALLSRAFDNIRRNRHRRSDQLTPE